MKQVSSAMHGSASWSLNPGTTRGFKGPPQNKNPQKALEKNDPQSGTLSRHSSQVRSHTRPRPWRGGLLAGIGPKNGRLFGLLFFLAESYFHQGGELPLPVPLGGGPRRAPQSCPLRCAGRRARSPWPAPRRSGITNLGRSHRLPCGFNNLHQF